MRDLLVALIVFASLPVTLFQPYVGVLVWTWISLMNPHRLAWGFALTFPFAKIVAAVTILAALNPSVPKRLPLSRETVVQILFFLWTIFTSIVALNQEEAWAQWSKVAKIQLVVFVTMALLVSRKRLDGFIWMIVSCVGFYGVKGGLFTLVTGGQYHVNGPDRSFIAGNNHLAVALVMVIPLMSYLHSTTRLRWVRAGLMASIALTFIATLGTQSRGAVIGLFAMMGYLVIRSRRKLLFGVLAVLLVSLIFLIMPRSWFDRMDTIRTYEQDGSAMGRINAWAFAVKLAMERPQGGGFECFTSQWFQLYAPDPTDVHDAHSIYFEVLGEHGFIGLLLFLLLGGLAWGACSRLTRAGSRNPETLWLSDLGRMLQVSFVGYAATGAFVGLAYFDLYYNLIAVVVVGKKLLEEQVSESLRDEPAQRARTRPPVGRLARSG